MQISVRPNHPDEQPRVSYQDTTTRPTGQFHVDTDVADVIITDAFIGPVFRTRDGAWLGVKMRDSGYEITCWRDHSDEKQVPVIDSTSGHHWIAISPDRIEPISEWSKQTMDWRAWFEDGYPYGDDLGPTTVLGPECFTNGDVICWRGENFYRPDAHPSIYLGDRPHVVVETMAGPVNVYAGDPPTIESPWMADREAVDPASTRAERQAEAVARPEPVDEHACTVPGRYDPVTGAFYAHAAIGDDYRCVTCGKVWSKILCDDGAWRWKTAREVMYATPWRPDFVNELGLLREGVPRQAQARIDAAIHQAIGTASTCWENLDATGVFDTDKARWVAEGLRDYLLQTEGL